MNESFVKRHPVACYFLLSTAITWIGSFLIAGPKFLQGEIIEFGDVLLMALFMFAGPSIGGITMTYLADGRDGLRNLLSRMCRWKAGMRWYAAIFLIPLVGILSVLIPLSIIISPDYTPGFFLMGIIMGLITGFFEEIGWIGFAYPKMKSKSSVLTATIVVGLFHGFWHLLATYIGAIQFLGVYFWWHFISMWIVGMTAMRVLQVWVYENTNGSVLMIQLMHAFSSGFLILLSPTPRVPAIEVVWYTVYAVVLWIAVAIVIGVYGKTLMKTSEDAVITK
jgi:membrane protease YdiL (CAAX protease family)